MEAYSPDRLASCVWWLRSVVSERGSRGRRNTTIQSKSGLHGELYLAKPGPQFLKQTGLRYSPVDRELA